MANCGSCDLGKPHVCQNNYSFLKQSYDYPPEKSGQENSVQISGPEIIRSSLTRALFGSLLRLVLWLLALLWVTLTPGGLTWIEFFKFGALLIVWFSAKAYFRWRKANG